MGKYAIVQKVWSVTEEGESIGSGWGLATAVPLDEATVRNLQRLGGRITDGEAAEILVRHHIYRGPTGSGMQAEKDQDRVVLQVAKEHGLWDPQAGEGTT